ncbi:MAG: hypothetical protein Q9182_006252 [Xanthomendoza sp. 2 TL-2023]
MLCANRPEGHILTSCFLDTILVPLCTWLYLTTLVVLAITGTRLYPHKPSDALRGTRFRDTKATPEAETHELPAGEQPRRRTKIHKAFSIIFYLLVLAQILMCILEIVRLSLANLGVGLLPFTFVALATAAAVRFTKGLHGRVYGWRYLNLALWIALIVINGVKIAEETKEGTGARKGSKYPVADEITDVSVMEGVYAVLAFLEVTLRA